MGQYCGIQAVMPAVQPFAAKLLMPFHCCDRGVRFDVVEHTGCWLMAASFQDAHASLCRQHASQRMIACREVGFMWGTAVIAALLLVVMWGTADTPAPLLVVVWSTAITAALLLVVMWSSAITAALLLVVINCIAQWPLHASYACQLQRAYKKCCMHCIMLELCLKVEWPLRQCGLWSCCCCSCCNSTHGMWESFGHISGLSVRP